MIRSTGRSGSSEIHVKVYNSVGQEMVGLSDKINVTVVDSISSTFATFGNKFVFKDGETNSVTLAEGSEEKITVRYFSDKDFLIDLADFEVLLSNNDVFEIITKADGIYLKLKPQADVPLNSEGKAEVTITLSSKATDKDGNLVKIRTTLLVQFL